MCSRWATVHVRQDDGWLHWLDLHRPECFLRRSGTDRSFVALEQDGRRAGLKGSLLRLLRCHHWIEGAWHSGLV